MAVAYPVAIQISEDFVYKHGEGRLIITSAALDAEDVPAGDLYLYGIGLPMHNKLQSGDVLSDTEIVAKMRTEGVLVANDEYYDLFIPKDWRGTLRFGVRVQTFESGRLVMRDLEETLGRPPKLSVEFHFD